MCGISWRPLDYIVKQSIGQTPAGLDLPDAAAIKNDQTNKTPCDRCSKGLVNYHKSECRDRICIRQSLQCKLLGAFYGLTPSALWECAEHVTDVTVKLKGLSSGTCTSCRVDSVGRLLTYRCLVAEAHVHSIVPCDQCCSADSWAPPLTCFDSVSLPLSHDCFLFILYLEQTVITLHPRSFYLWAYLFLILIPIMFHKVAPSVPGVHTRTRTMESISVTIEKQKKKTRPIKRYQNSKV